MKNKSFVFTSVLTALVLVLLCVPGVSAFQPMQHWRWGDNINLVQKDPATWAVIQNGAHGSFYTIENRFAFSAQGLVKNTQYTLLSYAEPYPGTGSKVIGTVMSDKWGRVFLNGKFSDISSVVYNIYGPNAAGDYQNTVGAKVWLVRTSDLAISGTTASFITWNPTNYLFERTLIDYPGLDDLKLVQKDTTTWLPLANGGQGQFEVTRNNGYTLSATKLIASTPYSLISYNENGASVTLATGTSTKKGALTLKGSSFAGSLIYNTYTTGEYSGLTGAKLWLVPTSDVTGGAVNWGDMGAFLYETHLILKP